MSIKESGEMYLENIYLMLKDDKELRAVDLAREMDYSKPSVSRALGILQEMDFIEIDDNGFISLTEKGCERAKKTYERHVLISQFFISLGVSEDVAKDDACRIEHVISDETFEILKEKLFEKEEKN